MASVPSYPYGYKLNFRGKKELHEERAAVVRLIYQKYIQGMNRYAITWYLINHKIMRPRGDSCAWQYSMVSKILTDERYLGNDSRYPMILAREIFEAAQDVRQKEKNKAIATRHESCNEKRMYPFSGFIKCGSCGSNYIRGLQRQNSSTRKASWRCRNYRLKNEGKCKASGNIYEEMLEVVCVEAYNKIRSECLTRKLFPKTKCQSDSDKSLEILIRETIDQMKKADENRLQELQNDLNLLINKRTAAEWETAPLDLSDYETEKIRRYFEKYPMPMTALDIERFKVVFSGIMALEPGELKLILRNGNEIYEKYKPMRGQVKNAQENRSYTCKADKRT